MLARRLATIRNKLAQTGATALLVTQPANVRYLSGFRTPEDARVLITEEKAILVTDGRYIAQAKEESQLEVDIAPSSTTWLPRVCELAKGHSLGFEADHLSYAQAMSIQEAMGAEPIPTTDVVTDLRLIKTEDELERIRQAAQITDEAFGYILNVIKPGLTEVEVSLELERFMRLKGAEKKAFDITVASGYRSSMPHGTASPKVIEKGELLTLDYGAVVEGYHSDMTRTLAVGEVSDRDRAIYDAVLEAETTALEAVAPEKDGKALHQLAFDVLEKHDLGQYFAHGLGHGVGLQIHEGPRLSLRRSTILKPGMVVTIEPGAYIPGEAGVRVEDLVTVTSEGYELLSQSDKSFIQL